MTKATNGGRRAGAGRKSRVTTVEMIEDLTKISKEEYCEKYKCGEMYFLNLYYKNVGLKEEKVVERVTPIDMFDGVLIDTDILYTKGFALWMGHIKNKQQETDWAMQDILHNMQKGEHTQAEKIVLFDMLADLRRENAKYDDSYAFGQEHKHKIMDLISLQKTVREKLAFLKVRVYKTRVLVKEFGQSF